MMMAWVKKTFTRRVVFWLLVLTIVTFFSVMALSAQSKTRDYIDIKAFSLDEFDSDETVNSLNKAVREGFRVDLYPLTSLGTTYGFLAVLQKK